MACGVPQGSVLGPLLFLLYVNDIYNASEKFKFHLFADDTNLLYGDKNLKSLETIVTAELSKVWDWLNANKLTLNVKKSNFVIFQPKGRRSNHQVKIKLIDNNTNSSTNLEQKVYVKPSRLNLLWNSVARFGTVLWNSLSITTRDLTHKQFKEKIHSTILNILAVENNYIDLASLLQKIRSL